MYPFDTQNCFIEINKREKNSHQFFLQLEEVTMENFEIIQYHVDNQLHYNNDSLSMENIKIEFRLQRQLTSYVFNTYFPSCGLMIVSVMTLFIDISHFEATLENILL